MLKRVILCLLPFLIGSCLPSRAQIDPQNITIARDSFGVPHIHAPTDAGVAYGLAWAHAEDDFSTIQDQLLVVRSRSAEVNGKASAPADVVVKMLGFSELVTDEAYETQLSAAFREVLEGYVQGINRYAQQHPAEVTLKGLFPVSGKDLVTGYLLGLALLTQTPKVIGDILDGKIGAGQLPKSTGSNVLAVAPTKTNGEGTFLAINSHQPLEGLYSWYEAHLISEEGTNILGATFPGGVSIFLGSNQHLGWSHTVNHADFNDVYRLYTDEAHPGQYRVDGKWLTLTERKAKIKVKLLGPIKVPVRRTYYETMFGPAFETPQGYFALSFAASRALKAPEQWWRMGKAENLTEFQAALRLHGITGTNIMYADKAGNIYYLGNASLPPRKNGPDWSGILPGDDSNLRWAESYVPIDSLAWYLNPSAGYLFNTNNTPFHATSAGDNLE
ncbi:MAG: penicillin acylase family protein, partial [Bacteroidota bacterium]